MKAKEFIIELKISDNDVKRIIKDRLAIDAETGIDAMRQAIDMMAKMPNSSFVKSQAQGLMMLYNQSKMRIGGDYFKKLNKLTENFADGKKPGRKGLAKRSGVNCKASVTSLRKTAKNSSGEKARMAHWCANMKSGKSKKK